MAGAQGAGDRHRAADLKEACVAATPAVSPQSSWPDLVTVNLTVRLIELIESWQTCLDFADYLAAPARTPSADVRAAAAQLGPKSMHTDPGIALLSALAAAVAMGLCAFFWIATAWPEGAGARSTVLAPVNGIVTNFDLLPGRYVNVGAAVFALIDSDSFRVEGYFEETKLRRIRVGEEATVKLIGDSRVLSGHVESIAYGIEDQNRSTSSELLASVNPTFSWVRLAQRIPVRIKLDYVPADLLLVAGRTATVSIGKIRWW